MKKSVQVRFYDKTNRGDDANLDWPPVEALKAVGWFSKKINQMPPEHIATAQISFDADPIDGDTWDPRIVITYDRPETDEEEAARKSKEAADAEKSAARDRARELDQLRRLLAKYPEEAKG